MCASDAQRGHLLAEDPPPQGGGGGGGLFHALQVEVRGVAAALAADAPSVPEEGGGGGAHTSVCKK
jgi:hypothetical protein